MADRAIVFDFDGVLADSEAVHEEALLVAAAKLGMTAIRDQRPGRYVGLGDVEAFGVIAAANGRTLDPEELRVLIALKGVAFAAVAHTGAIPAYPGSIELLRGAAGVVPVAVCSGSRRADIEPVLESFGVLDVLAAFVTADDVPRTKPDPAPYLLAAQRLGLHPDRCVAIEDSPAGIAAARGAGYRVHAVCHTFDHGRLADAHHVHGCIANLTLERLLG